MQGAMHRAMPAVHSAAQDCTQATEGAWTAATNAPRAMQGCIQAAPTVQTVALDHDLDNSTARPSQHHIQNLLNSSQVFSSTRAPPAFRWLQLRNHIMSLEKLTMRGCPHMQSLQFALHDSWDQSVDSPFQLVSIPREVLPSLQWWSQTDCLTQGVPPLLPSSLSYIFSPTP